MTDLDDEFLRFQAELASVENDASQEAAVAPAVVIPGATTSATAPSGQQAGQHPAAPAAQHGQHQASTSAAAPAAAAPLAPPSAPPPVAAHQVGQQHVGHQMNTSQMFSAPGMAMHQQHQQQQQPHQQQQQHQQQHQQHMIPPPPVGMNGMMMPPQMQFNMRPSMGFLPPPMSMPPVLMAPPTLVPVSYTPAGMAGGQQAYGGYNASSSGMGGMAASTAPAAAAAAAVTPAAAAASGPPLTDAQKAKAAKIEEKKKKGVLREAAGERWRDPTLMEWPENDYRIFVGDLGTEVSDELLARHFKQYSSFAKAKIVRDKRTNKSKGFGFVSFLDSADFAKALREMNGKYVGNRPCKLSKSTWDDRAGTFKRKDGSLGGGPSKNKKPKT